MSFELYQVQSSSAHLCVSAREVFAEPWPESKLRAVEMVVRARLMNLQTGFIETIKAIHLGRWVVRCVKAIVIPMCENFSLYGMSRSVFLVGLLVSIIALRVLSSVAGIISPELTFGLLRTHRFLLWLSLIQRSERAIIGRGLPGELQAIVAQMDSRRWRAGAVREAFRLIDEVDDTRTRLNGGEFRDQIWRPALQQSLMTEIERVQAEFNQPVHVSHPVLEQFQRKLIELIHQEVVAVVREGLYEKDEVEDMFTAYQAVVNRASFQFIESELNVSAKRDPSGLITYDLTLVDGTKIEGDRSGGLEGWKKKIIDMKLLLWEVPTEQKALLPLFLCADTERCRRIQADLPEVASLVLINKVFKFIGEFTTSFVNHHMPTDGAVIQRAFSFGE